MVEIGKEEDCILLEELVLVVENVVLSPWWELVTYLRINTSGQSLMAFVSAPVSYSLITEWVRCLAFYYQVLNHCL